MSSHYYTHIPSFHYHTTIVHLLSIIPLISSLQYHTTHVISSLSYHSCHLFTIIPLMLSPLHHHIAARVISSISNCSCHLHSMTQLMSSLLMPSISSHSSLSPEYHNTHVISSVLYHSGNLFSIIPHISS